eukprot:scaffold380628_cov63-Attheya_sp.AAC.1
MSDMECSVGAVAKVSSHNVAPVDCCEEGGLHSCKEIMIILVVEVAKRENGSARRAVEALGFLVDGRLLRVSGTKADGSIDFSIFLAKADEVVFDGQLKGNMLVIQFIFCFGLLMVFLSGRRISCKKSSYEVVRLSRDTKM